MQLFPFRKLLEKLPGLTFVILLHEAVFSSNHMKASMSYLLVFYLFVVTEDVTKKIEFSDQGDPTKLNQFRVPHFRLQIAGLQDFTRTKMTECLFGPK